MRSLRLLGSGDADVLGNVAEDVFDHAVDRRWAAEFLSDPRHHLAVALDGERVVGMASAVHYVHPDKAPVLWVNEVGVAPTHRRRGIATQLLGVLVNHGRSLGCTEAWLGTEASNAPARALYRTAGWEEDGEPFVMYALALDGEAGR